MPLISTIGRREAKVRALVWAIYGVLTLGAVTMIYPFLLMLGGSTKSAVDSPDAEIIPRFLVDETALYQKHLEGLYNESAPALQNACGLGGETFRRLELPAGSSALTDDWRAFTARFKSEHPEWFVLGYLRCPVSRGVVPFNLRKLRDQLLAEEGGIAGVNRKYGTSFATASAFTVVPPNFLNRSVDCPDTEFLRRVERFSLEQPERWRGYVSVANFFRSFLQVKYGSSLADFNAAKGTDYSTWEDIPVADRAAGHAAAMRGDFDEFARVILNPVFIILDPAAAAGYRHYLFRKYNGDLAALNRRHETKYASFEEIPLPPTLPGAGVAKSDWKGFVEGWPDPQDGGLLAAPLEAIRLTGPDFAFRDFLREKYGTPGTLNAKRGTSFADWDLVPMPQREAQYEEFHRMQGWLRWEFVKRNYADVWDYLVINGRGLFNTVIYCLLAILAALTVDPIAAYALSRFKPRATYKVLLFLMMTMAFPAMVTQIPMFLLLRDLGLLNTFWALVLPGLANGYHIFLLKGFFDSLPKELYESAEIDGASEWTIFFHITMALSKPILAVIALGAFTAAYAAFMFALLLCQDPKMWTLMVWLYQLQQSSGPGIVYASLIIAAIPTLLVFVACQNVIMRGIVVPVEK